MRSPYPGMDPYLEDPAYWPDFHRTFINYLREAILDHLPPGYDARVDEQLRLVEYHDPETRLVYPDVTVLHDAGRAVHEPTEIRPSGVATLEPVTIPAPPMAEVHDVWIEVRHLPDQAVVTVIELLSPANRGDGYLEYLAKRRAILERPVHLIQIDFLLGGRRLDFGPRMPRADYYTFISRQGRRQWVDIYRWGIRDRLPSIPVPLLQPDPDLPVDLAAVFATAYERGHYGRALRYGGPLPASLGQTDAAWVASVLNSGQIS